MTFAKPMLSVAVMCLVVILLYIATIVSHTLIWIDMSSIDVSSGAVSIVTYQDTTPGRTVANFARANDGSPFIKLVSPDIGFTLLSLDQRVSYLLSIPLWPIASAALVIGAVAARRSVRRDLVGHCAGCGYPVSHRFVRCPECGRTTTPSTSSEICNRS